MKDDDFWNDDHDHRNDDFGRNRDETRIRIGQDKAGIGWRHDRFWGQEWHQTKTYSLSRSQGIIAFAVFLLVFLGLFALMVMYGE